MPEVPSKKTSSETAPSASRVSSTPEPTHGPYLPPNIRILGGYKISVEYPDGTIEVIASTLPESLE